MKKRKPKPRKGQAIPVDWLELPKEAAAPARKRAQPIPMPQDRLDQRSCLLATRALLADMTATCAQIILEIDHALK